jgi:hypothetical protein
MGLPSSALTAFSAWKGRFLFRARAWKIASAIGLRQTSAVQTTTIFFTRFLATMRLQRPIQTAGIPSTVDPLR